MKAAPRVAMVSGGNRGIGLAIVRELLAHGLSLGAVRGLPRRRGLLAGLLGRGGAAVLVRVLGVVGVVFVLLVVVVAVGLVVAVRGHRAHRPVAFGLEVILEGLAVAAQALVEGFFFHAVDVRCTLTHPAACVMNHVLCVRDNAVSK